LQAIGGAADAARMQRVVAFYEKLPRGPAPAAQPKGLLQRYQHRYMNGKNARAARTYRDHERHVEGRYRDTDYCSALAHLIGGLLVIGYAQNYYFHLRKKAPVQYAGHC
jgi:F-type H+-transporting ATPase subunit f